MLNYIEDIINRFGGRYLGSEQEKKAQYYTAEILKKYCDKVEVEEFESPLEAHFQSLKIFCIVYVMVLVLMKINVQYAAILGVLNTVLFNGHFVTYRHWLDFLFPNKTSWNLIGDIEPTEKATSTLIIAGHIDSVKEFKWWYKLKAKGAILTVFAGFLLTLLGVYAFFSLFIQAQFFQYLWWIFVLLSPILIVFYDMHGEKVVEGASDNLTGVALAVEMAKVFSRRKLKNTRLRLISFGSEEACLRGSYAYAKKHKEQLLQEKAFLVNLDTIKEKAHLTIITAELNTLVFFKKENIDLIENAFNATQTPYKKLPLTVGATDASAFHILGLSAISLIGMQSETLDPSYHTRLDTVEYINPDGMEAMREVLINFVETWDMEKNL